MAETSGEKFTISQVIDSMGVSKFTISLFFLVGLAMMFDGYDNMIISYTNTQIMNDFFPLSMYGGDTAAQQAATSALKGALSSWGTIGLVIGSFFAGPLSDKLGRTKGLTVGVFLYGLFTIPCIFAPSYEIFAGARVIAGFFLGICGPIVTTMFTEYTPTKQRSFFITFGMAWMIVGWVVAALVANAVVQHATWHLCYAIGAIPVVYAFIFHAFTPESAHWLTVKGRPEDAIKQLNRVIKRSGKQVPFDMKPENIIVPPVSEKASPAEVWKGKYLKTTIALTIVYFAGNFSIYGLNAWLPSLMLEATNGATTAAYMLAMAQNAASVLANCSTGYVSEAIGRRRNLAFGYVFSVCMAIVTALVVMLPAQDNFWPYLISFVFMGFAFNYGITAAQPMMSEAYPTEFRSSGVATIVALGRTGAILSPVILGGLKGAGLGFTPLIALLAIPMGIGWLATFLLPKGAKGMDIDDIANADNE